MKIRHFATRNLDPPMDADIFVGKRSASLNVWLVCSRGNPRKLIYGRKFKDADEAIEAMKGFGHGYEYMGAKWVELMPDGSVAGLRGAGDE